jgi:signal transduction histidine kinase
MSKTPSKRARESSLDVKRIEESLERKNIAFEALFKLFEKIGTTLDLGTIIRLFLLTLMGQLRVKRIALYLVSSDGGRFEAHHILGIGLQALPETVRAGDAFSRWLKGADGARHIDGFFANARGGVTEGTARFLGDLVEHGFAYAFPLTDQDGLLGVVFYSGKVTGEGFSRFDNELLRMLAKVATITIKNAALYSAAVRSKLELEKFSKIKKEFISHTSHELRTPITVLKSALWSIEPGEVEEGILIDMSKDAVLRMQIKVEQLLSLNDIELNATSFDLAPTDVSSLLEDCLREIIPELEEKQVTVDFIERTGCREIMVDASKMKLVFRSIIDNAVNFVERGGEISVVTEITDVPPGELDGIEMQDWAKGAEAHMPNSLLEGQEGEAVVDVRHRTPDGFNVSSGESYLVTRIRDNGIGIPTGEIANLAEPFARASNSPMKNVKGLGIGLSVAQKIIAGHGGKLLCRSEEGKGAEFSIWLLTD